MNTPLCMENEQVNVQVSGDNQLAHPNASIRLHHQSSTSRTLVDGMVLSNGSTRASVEVVEDISTTSLSSLMMAQYEEEEKDSILSIIDKVFEVLDNEKYRRKKQKKIKTQVKHAKPKKL